MKVELFVPCIIDQFYPEVASNTVKVLERAGVEVEYNPEQTCCGRFAYNAGFIEDAKELGDKFLNDFSYNGPVVAPRQLVCITSKNVILSCSLTLPTI